jgi:hypothetical protein
MNGCRLPDGLSLLNRLTALSLNDVCITRLPLSIGRFASGCVVYSILTKLIRALEHNFHSPSIKFEVPDGVLGRRKAS